MAGTLAVFEAARQRRSPSAERAASAPFMRWSSSPGRHHSIIRWSSVGASIETSVSVDPEQVEGRRDVEVGGCLEGSDEGRLRLVVGDLGSHAGDLGVAGLGVLVDRRVVQGQAPVRAADRRSCASRACCRARSRPPRTTAPSRSPAASRPPAAWPPWPGRSGRSAPARGPPARARLRSKSPQVDMANSVDRMRIGMLTGGGDCPGLNAVMRAVVRKGERTYGDEVLGFLDGWRGVMDGRPSPSTSRPCAASLPRGGTLIGSSRTNPFNVEGGADAGHGHARSFGIDALIAIGGDDTLGVAERLHGLGVAVVGVPKTIDNDLSGTEMTFGFDTAVQIATDAIDRLHTTGRVAPPRDGRRGHGSPRRPHRHVVGHGRRGGDDPDPRGALRHRPGVRCARPPPHRSAATRRSWWWPRGPCRPRGPRHSCPTRPTSSATRGWAAPASGWPTRSSAAPGSRPAPRCSATCSGAARPPPSTACWPPASASPPSTRCTTAPSARWWRLQRRPDRAGAAGRGRRLAQAGRPRAVPRRGRGVLRGMSKRPAGRAGQSGTPAER